MAAATRTLVPAGGTVPQGADDLGLIDELFVEVDNYPPRALRRTKLLLFATEYLPLVSGKTRRFSKLGDEARLEVLERNARHKRSPLRRLIVSYVKQLVYSAYISQAPVEDAVGYSGECLRPSRD
ncbi:MAG: hypothetical protein WD826_09505 [Actinomycetota bacterium]